MAEGLRIRVIVRLKPGVLDPQGKTIGNVLRSLGYGSVVRVHTGKVFDIEWNGVLDEAGRRQVLEIVEKVLSNPLIETFEVEWPEGRDGSSEVPCDASGRRGNSL